MSVVIFNCFIYFSCFLVKPRSLWDLSSLTRNQTYAPRSGAQSPNPWAAREFIFNCSRGKGWLRFKSFKSCCMYLEVLYGWM